MATPQPKKKDTKKSRLEKIQEHFAKTAGDERWWKPKNPKSYIRILPEWGPAADEIFYFTASLHYGFSVGGRDKAAPCPRSIGKDECFICDAVNLLKESGDEDNVELSKKLRARRKYWVNLLVSNKEGEHSDKVYMYGANKKFIDHVIQAMDNDDYGDVTDVENGHDIIIGKTGEGMATRYQYQTRPKATSVTNENWKDLMYQLDKEVLEFWPDAEILSALKRQYGDVLSEVGFKFPKSKAQLKKVEPEHDEDDDDSEGEDEEEEEKPASKKNKKAKQEEDEDDDEEDGEDEN